MDAEILPMWQTPIWIGQVDADLVHRVAGHADPDTETNLGSHTDSIQSLAHLEGAVAAAVHPDQRRLQWRHRLAVWPAGFYRGMTYSRATIHALVIVASNQPGQHPDSGVVSLHDPRTGAANVALPGLPWGRTMKIPPVTGGAVAIPGWLGYSIAPLRGSHTMTVWTAEATAVEQ